ncbi:MAG: 4-(cytidine 5'-diphospho)-2-C-methyl-D-erythritol kinase [Pseudomonadota bacterium]
MHVTDRNTVSPPAIEKAYAKINLNLEVLGLRPDGYHELVSLVAFARDVFDVVTVTPAGKFSLVVSGPSGQHIDGDNLVLQAAEQAATIPAVSQQPGRIDLIKNLPVAAGLGGGSADAAATLRAIARLNAIDDIETAFAGLCPKLGADVPVCLQSGDAQAALMWGLGEQVWRPTGAGGLLPPGLSALLVNPGQPVPTGAVFRALAASPLEDVPSAPDKPGPFKTTTELVRFLQNSRNDLEKPARSITPLINDVLCALRTQPDCQLARMSGSGATCFGLFEDLSQAETAKARLAAQQTNWWLATTRLV